MMDILSEKNINRQDGVVSETRHKMIGGLWNEKGQVNSQAASHLKIIRFWESPGFALIISCMVFMHFNRESARQANISTWSEKFVFMAIKKAARVGG